MKKYTVARTHQLLMRHLYSYPRLTDAVRELNAVLGTRYDLARIGQWRRGERSIPGLVRGYMIGLAEAVRRR